jgi:hypothetical protein
MADAGAVIRTATANSIGMVLAVTGLAIQILLLIRARGRPAPAPVPLPAPPVPEASALRLAGLLLGLYVLLFFLAPSGISAAPDTAQGRGLVVLQTLAFQVGTLGFVAIALRRRGLGWREAFAARPLGFARSAGRAAVFYLCATPHVLIFGLLAQGLLRAAGVTGEMQPVVQVLSSAQPLWLRVYLVVLGVAVAPVAEEVLFRGILMPLILRRLGPAPAVLLVALFFALLHFNVFAFVPLFVIGIGFGLSYLMSGDLRVPVMMHALFNAVSFALLGLQGGIS